MMKRRTAGKKIRESLIKDASTYTRAGAVVVALVFISVNYWNWISMLFDTHLIRLIHNGIQWYFNDGFDREDRCNNASR